MQLKVEEADGVHFIVPEGEMVTGDGDVRLKAEFEKLISGGHFRVVLDFSEVPYIDSSVLGQLVHGYSLLKKNGGSLKFVSPTRRILDLLTLTRLITVFEIYSTRAEAAASWKD